MPTLPLRWNTLLAATVALALAVSSGGSARAAESPESIATRQNLFSIPFQLEKGASAADDPVEVQLQVSNDEGTTWQMASKVKPEAGKFVYRAPRDGQYCFAIRTLNKQGQSRPEGAVAPGLRVIVDTAAPKIELKAERGAAGEVIARWQANDPNLRPESLRLEVQAGVGAPWKPLAIKPADQNFADQSLTGETTWWPQSGGGQIAVRAQIADRAGNPASSQVSVTLDERPNSSDPPEFARRPPALDRDAAPRLDRPQTARDAEDQRNWRSARPEGATTRPISSERSVERGEAGGPLDRGGLPPGEHPRMVNARSFELEYDVESVGPSGIAKVELWGTRDSGRSWSSFGLDNDNRSPMSVTVDGAGYYGFQIVVQSGSGLGGAEPREGDLPEIWVGVDLSLPTAKIVAADLGREGTELTIRWEAADDLMDPRPIALSFGERPNGPWTPIASGLENNGSYLWRLDARTPDQIYLRLEARDEAGNTTAVVSADPVSLDRQRPQGKIRSVRPIGGM